MKFPGFLRTVAIGMMSLGAGTLPVAHAQDYPAKPVRLFASTAGGGTDVAARVLSQGLAAGMGQPSTVGNRLAFVSIEAVAKSPPDGYSLLVMGIPVWLAPYLQDNVPWDPVRDFQPVTTLTRQVTVLMSDLRGFSTISASASQIRSRFCALSTTPPASPSPR